MYGGRVAESGSREQILRNMNHPYTQRLFSSIPKLEKMDIMLNTIPGLVPSATEYGEGCRFAGRCPEVMDICHEQESKTHLITNNHETVCHLIDKDSQFPRKYREKSKPLPNHKLDGTPFIKIRNLSTHFPVRKGLFLRVAGHIQAVDNINIDIPKGSTVALVGESGCGKSTLAESILQLVPEAQGEVFFKDQNIMSLQGESLKGFRKHMQIVFQDPFGSLQPRMTIEKVVGEGLEVHQPMLSTQEQTKKIIQALEEVGMSLMAFG